MEDKRKDEVCTDFTGKIFGKYDGKSKEQNAGKM